MRTIKYKNYTIRIEQETYPMNPRTEYDNLGLIHAAHRNYDLGDKLADAPKNLFISLATKKEIHNAVLKSLQDNKYTISLQDWKNELSPYDDYKDFLYDIDDDQFFINLLPSLEKLHILPVYMYDHGGVALNTSGFSCPWDSGLLGYIYCTEETRIKEGLTVEQVISNLKNEIITYSQFLQGDVYGFIIEDNAGNEIESCWGFYGYDYCLEEARAVIDYLDKKELNTNTSGA